MVWYVPAIVVAVVVIVWVLEAVALPADQSDFNRRFPPISDDEFLARCRPGVNRNTALRVRRIVAEQLGVAYDRVYPSSRFVEDFNVD